MIAPLIASAFAMASAIANDYWWAVAIYVAFPFAYIRPVDHASAKELAKRALVKSRRTY